MPFHYNNLSRLVGNMRVCGHLDEAGRHHYLSFITSNTLLSHCHYVLEHFAKHKCEQRRDGAAVPPAPCWVQNWTGLCWNTTRTRPFCTHAWDSPVPSLTLSDVIGDGEFVYHIWQNSAPTGIRIGRGQPSLTRRLPRSFTNIAEADGSCSHKQTLPVGTRGKNQPFLSPLIG